MAPDISSIRELVRRARRRLRIQGALDGAAIAAIPAIVLAVTAVHFARIGGLAQLQPVGVEALSHAAAPSWGRFFAPSAASTSRAKAAARSSQRGRCCPARQAASDMACRNPAS